MKNYLAIGLMSGTSMDGVDLALIESNGENYLKILDNDYLNYNNNFKTKLAEVINNKQELSFIKNVEQELTNIHIQIVKQFLNKKNLKPKDIDIIGFHGHTIYHSPKNSTTWQIGNSFQLAINCQIDVIGDFRSKDLILGGQGAPLVPIYHFHLLKNSLKITQQNIAILNIGGVSNLSIFNKNDENSLIGFDVCFGNAVFDDLVKQQLNQDFDVDGKITSHGMINTEIASKILQNEIFYRAIPRAFDRQDFFEILKPLQFLSLEDRLATYSFILANALKIALEQLPNQPQIILICGGGRKNRGIFNQLAKTLPTISVANIDDYGFNGDSIEAEAFAFLAIRSLQNQAISFKNTTGLKNHLSACGGVLYRKD